MTLTGLDLYDRAAQDAADAVIARYSTSFGLAARLLGARVRPHVRALYALVRVADETVDGPAGEAGLDLAAQRAALDELETDTERAMATGFSTNLVVHAFARTARACRIGVDLTRPFFESMRTDLAVSSHDDASHAAYVYGSAEVVGLMCLQAFVHADRPHAAEPSVDVVDGARSLGRAFQDVNFLRDLGDDSDVLGRDYLGVRSDAERVEVLDRIDADLARAAEAVPALPADCRRAVVAAHALFAELSRRLRASGPADGRVRVPDPVKAVLIARAALNGAPHTPAHARAERVR